MASTGRQAAIAERRRLDACSREPIHIPGAIQPHGALLTVHPDTFTILQASTNSHELLGVAHHELLGTSLGAFLGTDSVDRFREILNREVFGANPVVVTIGERQFDAIVHESGGLGVVEFEPQGSS